VEIAEQCSNAVWINKVSLEFEKPMGLGKETLKKVVLKTCSPQLQRRIRRLFLVRQVLERRGFREPEMLALKSLVSPGNSVADIGANVGVYTKELSSLVGPTGHVYSFEPILDTFEILQAVISKANLSNVSSFKAALGSQPAEHEMVIPDLGGFTGYYWAHLARTGDSGRREKVKVLTLDGLWKSNSIQRLDFIKCDVEGGELEVMHGGLALIQSQLPGWLLEVSRETSDEVFRILKDFGYRAFVYDSRLVEVDGYRDKEFSNYFFLHPKSGPNT
jgi:FkbM family methyltransferase